MSDAKSYAQRNQRGSDWFSHDGTAASKPAPAAAPAPKPAEPAADQTDGSQSSRAQMIKPKCDSNQWFYHEHSGAKGAAEPAPAAAAAAEPTPEPAVTAAVSAPVAAEPADKKQAREGDAYGKRDKAGSAASWFTHDHTEPNAQQGPRVNTKEGGANASRMRGESENWFNYDNKQGQQDVHVGKARGRPQQDSMHQIFNQGQ